MGHQLQLQKAAYMENLGDRVNQLDEMRQQSEAKAKDEVDATISQSNRLINTIQTEFDEKVKLLENFVKDEQATLISKSQEISKENKTLIIDVEERVKRNEDQIKHIDDTLDGLHYKIVEEITKENKTLISDVEERVKQNEDQIKHIDDTLDGLHRTVTLFEGRQTDVISSFSSELDKKLNDVDLNISVKLTKHESENRENFEKIE